MPNVLQCATTVSEVGQNVPGGRAGMDALLPDLVLRDQWKPNYRARHLDDCVFVSSDQGTWLFLTQEEFGLLRSIALPRALYRRLEDRGLIITERNAGCVMRAYQQWSSGYFVGTSLHILGMTRRCNLRCLYCHAAVVRDTADPSHFDMDKDTARAIVDFAFQSPAERVHFEFQGGEASLNFDVVRYVHSYASLLNLKYKRRISFSIVTNGVELSDEVIDFLDTSGMNVTTSVELSGPQEEGFRIDHDGVARRAEVEQTRKRLRERGIFVPILVVIGRNNLHRMREYVDLAVESGQSSIFFSPVQKLGFAKGTWDEVGIEMDEFFEAYRDALEYVFEHWDRGILLEERYFSLALEKLFSDHDTRYMDYRNPNGMVFGDLAYDHRGDIYACDEGRGHADFRIGNVFKDSYAAVVASEKARQLVSYSLREHPECSACGYRAFCGVSPIVSKGEFGTLDTPPIVASTCQRTLHLFDFVTRLIRERPARIDQALAIISFARG